MPTIIEEYLSSLGFKIDEPSWEKFKSRLDEGKARAVTMGASFVGTAVTVSAAVAKIAHQYNELYFVAQRTNASIGGLRGYASAFERIGLTSEAAVTNIETIAQRIRLNPGVAALLQGRGINTSNPTQAATDYVADLKRRYGPKKYFAAAAEAQDVLGIDERTFKQQWDNIEKLKAQQTEYARRLALSGINMDEFGKKSEHFVAASNNLLETMHLILVQTGDKWLPTMKTGVDWLDKFAQGLTEVGKSTGGWSSSILSLIAALGGLKVTAYALSFIPGMSSVATALGAPAAVAAWGVKRVTGPLGFLLGSTNELNKGEVDLEKLSPEDRERAIARMHAKGPVRSRDQARDETVAYFMSKGWTREQATGIAANFYAESKFNPNAVGDSGKAYGIGQWHPDRRANFKRVFGKDMRDSSFQEQLAFTDWELRNTERKAGDALRETRSAAGAAVVVSRLYERPADAMGQAMSRGLQAQHWFNTGPMAGPQAADGPVTISQKNDFHVMSTNPKEAAAEVLSGQGRANGDLVRNLQGAVR